MINLHTHTPRCRHARGSEREYIERAIETGYTLLGFSDHAPMPFPGDYYSGFRMRVNELSDYVTTLLALKEEYKNQIDIKIGLETEYYPNVFPNYLKLIGDYPIDYLLFGMHFMGNEIGEEFGSGHETNDKARVTRYVDQSIEGLETKKYTYMAHPDLINYTGDDDEFFKEEMRRLVKKAKELNIPLEINMLGIKEGRSYPNKLLWQVVGEEGALAVIGADAHDVIDLGNMENYNKALDFAKRFGVTVTEDIKLINPNK